jgi:hypothetical protein
MGSKRRRIHRKSKTQRMYNMKGCSKKKGCVGGNKNKTRRRRQISKRNLFVTYTGGQKGGCGSGMCSIGGAVGGTNALVGSPWNIANSAHSNHYALNTYTPDISRQMIATGSQPPFSGGERVRRRRMKSKKGGGMLDYAPYIAGTVTSALGGYKGPASPSPTYGHFSK